MTSSTNDFQQVQYLGMSAVRFNRAGTVRVELSYMATAQIRLLTPHFCDAGSLNPVSVPQKVVFLSESQSV